MSIIETPNKWVLSGKTSGKTKVGSDQLAWCSQCKMNLMHTIITLTDKNIAARVLCNTCKTERNYRAPKEIDTKSQPVGGKMLDNDEDQPLHQEERAKKEIFGETGEGKKKAKAKAKAKPKTKKAKAESDNPADGSGIPLSMQPPSDDDKRMFENKNSAFKASHGVAKEYAMGPGKFTIGEAINHKKFGLGFVFSEQGANKIEVLFKEGKKLLIHGYQP